MHRMQQEFQVLTAKISGLDEKKKKKKRERQTWGLLENGG